MVRLRPILMFCLVAALLALPAMPQAQLPAPPAVAAILGPPPPRGPLPRLERMRDGAPDLGCPVTFVAGLGAVTARHCAGNLIEAHTQVRIGDARSRVLGARLAAESPFDDNGRLRHPQHDWAVLDLAAPVPPTDVFTYVGRAGLVGADREHPLVKLGPGATPAAPPNRGACWPTDVGMGGYVFAFRCSSGTGPGRSGSPLLVATETGYGFVGIHIAEFDGPLGKTGIAVVPPPP